MTPLFPRIKAWRLAFPCVFLIAFIAQAAVQSAYAAEAVSKATAKAQILPTVINGFVHPGIGLNQRILEDARAQVLVKRDPWYAGFVRFASSPRCAKNVSSRNQSKADPARPEVDAFDNKGVEGRLKIDSDVALRQALMYWFTGDLIYRTNAMRIVRLWSKMNPAKFKAYNEVYIHCSFAYKDMIVAAELLRSMDSPSPDQAWTEADTTAFTDNYVVPGVKTFFDYNGWFMNQNGFAYAPAIAGAIFRGDPQELAKRVERFTVNQSGPNKGASFSIHDLARLVDTNALTSEKVAKPQVQITEMGRDQAHAGDDMTIFTTIGRILNSQGIKVDPREGTVSRAPDAVGPYEFLDDRILAAADHFCRFMLGYDTAWIPTPSNIAPDGTVRQVYSRIADNYRGRIRQHQMWDLYYHYTYERGIDLAKKAPYYHETYLKRIVSGEYEWLYIPKQAEGEALRIPPSEQEPATVEVEQRSANLSMNVSVQHEGSIGFVRALAAPQGVRLSILSCATERKTVGLRIRTNGSAEIAMSGFEKPWLLPNTQGEWRQVFYTMSALERFGDIVFFRITGTFGTTVDLDRFLRQPDATPPMFAAGDAPLRIVAYVGALIRLDFSPTAPAPQAGTTISLMSLDKPESAALDPATGIFSWKPTVTGNRVFLVQAANGTAITPKKVEIAVAADRAAALATIKAGWNEKTVYVTTTLRRYQILFDQVLNSVKSASDADFFTQLLTLKEALDALEPLTPMLPDGSMDFPRVVVSSNIGLVATNLLVDGNDDTFVGFYLAPELFHEFDFGADFKFSATAFAVEGRNNFEDRVDNTKFYGSNDRRTWTELTAEGVRHAAELRRIAVADNLSASRFRFLRFRRLRGNLIEPSEMRIYGQRHESGNQLDAISLSAEKNQGSRVALGERVRLTIQARAPLHDVRVLIQGVEAVTKQTGDSIYIAESVLQPGKAKAGPLEFTIDYFRQDGNPGDTAYATTDGSRLVVVDESKLLRDVAQIAKINDPNIGTLSPHSQRMLNSLFDNDPRTYTEISVQGRGDNTYLEFDFGPAQRVHLTNVELLARPGYRDRIAGAIVDGSHDRMAWTTLTQSADKTEDWQTLRMKPSDDAYRYLRIFNRAPWYGNVSEVRFHGEIK